ncbi:hypothetical protein [Gracilibacillus oryzae]|nr:hypothetical protein [Gracilibacillus oryzae]
MTGEPFELSEDILKKYDDLNKQKKTVEQELNLLKKQIHFYLDELFGKEQKGEVKRGNYKVQRVIRSTIQYDEEETVKKLEQLNLTDFLVKKPDTEKLEAAIKIELVKGEDFKDCKMQKLTQAITVKEIG